MKSTDGIPWAKNVITNTFLILGASPSCRYDDQDNEVHQMPEQGRPEPQVPGRKCLTSTFNFHLFKASLYFVYEKKVIQVAYLSMSLLSSCVSNSMLEATSFPYEWHLTAIVNWSPTLTYMLTLLPRLPLAPFSPGIPGGPVGPISPFSPLRPSGPFETSHNAWSVEPTFPNGVLLTCAVVPYMYYNNCRSCILCHTPCAYLRL